MECKESRIGKKPIEVPSNVTLTLEEQFVKAKGPLGELSLSYPGEVKVVKGESGKLRLLRLRRPRGRTRCTDFSGKRQLETRNEFAQIIFADLLPISHNAFH